MRSGLTVSERRWAQKIGWATALAIAAATSGSASASAAVVDYSGFYGGGDPASPVAGYAGFATARVAKNAVKLRVNLANRNCSVDGLAEFNATVTPDPSTGAFSFSGQKRARTFVLRKGAIVGTTKAQVKVSLVTKELGALAGSATLRGSIVRNGRRISCTQKFPLELRTGIATPTSSTLAEVPRFGPVTAQGQTSPTGAFMLVRNGNDYAAAVLAEKITCLISGNRTSLTGFYVIKGIKLDSAASPRSLKRAYTRKKKTSSGLNTYEVDFRGTLSDLGVANGTFREVDRLKPATKMVPKVRCTSGKLTFNATS